MLELDIILRVRPRKKKGEKKRGEGVAVTALYTPTCIVNSLFVGLDMNRSRSSLTPMLYYVHRKAN